MAENDGQAPPGESQNVNSTAMTMEEMESQLAANEEPVVAPEVADPTAPWKEALRISEEARISASARIQPAAPPPVAAAPPDPVENLSDDDIARIIEEKGTIAGIRAIQAQTLKVMERHANIRLGALTESGATVAENNARAKYAMEFELFGDEIKALVDSAPDKTALNNPVAWDNMIAWVRGKDGNITRYAERLGAKGRSEAESAAREGQRAMAGAHGPSGGPSSGSGVSAGADGTYGLDNTQREIADKLGRSYKDYATWMKVG